MARLEDRVTKLEERLHAKGNTILATELHMKEQIRINEDIEKRMRVVEKSGLRNSVIIGLIGAASAIGLEKLIKEVFK